MKRNITLLLPLGTYKKQIAKQLATKLKMHFIDVGDLLKFELVDTQKVLEVAGKEYLERQENKIVQRVASFSDAVITLDLSTLNTADNMKQLKETSLFVYLRFLEKDYIKLLKKEKNSLSNSSLLDQKLFAERDEFFKKISDVVVNCTNTNKRDIIKQTILQMHKLYE